MFYKLTKKFFEILINTIQITRVVFVFWCFFIILYWILQIAQVKFIENFAMFFEPLKDFVHAFYNKDVVIDKISVDFSFLYATFFILLMAWGLKYFAEFIERTEEKYDQMHNFIREKSEEVFNLKLNLENKNIETQNKNFLILTSFCAKNLKKDSFFDKNADVGSEEKEKIFANLFFSNLAQSLSFQKRELGKNILMYFNTFENVDKAIINFEDTFKKMKSDFKEQGWLIDFLACIEPYSHAEEIKEKLSLMEKLMNLELKNEVICLSSFKQRYSIISKPHYILSCKGVYDIKGFQEVFCLINKNVIKKV